VLVTIKKPAETPGVAGEFYCPIQTTGLGDDEFVTAIFGVDGFQAIEPSDPLASDSPTSTPRTVVALVGSTGSYLKSGISDSWRKISIALKIPESYSTALDRFQRRET
jgi:hypothetical protein